MAKSVFISSTSKDLGAYRAAVKTAIEQLEMRAIDMKNFGARDDDATGVSLAEVRKADYFIGILANRYGYMPERTAKSVTEQEYDEASRRRIPCLMYILDPEYRVDQRDPLYQHADFHPRLTAFKNRVEKERVRSLFTTPENLAQQVTRDLARLRDRGKQQRMIMAILATIGLIALLLAAVLLADSGVRSNLIEVAGLASETPTVTITPTATATFTSTPPPTTTLTPTSTATDTPTATFTPSVTPTPKELPFAPGEMGVVLANFNYIDPDATRVEPNLIREFENAGISYIRHEEVISSPENAQALLQQYNSRIVVWGEVARGGAVIRFETVRQDLGNIVTWPITNFAPTEVTTAANEVTSFEAYIFEGMDTLYAVHMLEGEILLNQNNYTEAVAALDQAAALIPPGREADVSAHMIYFLRGTANFNLAALEQGNPIETTHPGDFNTSIEDYTRAIAIQAEFREAYVFRALAYAAQHDTELAAQDLRSIASFPQGKDLYYYLTEGTAHLFSGNYEGAVNTYTYLIETYPEVSMAVYIFRGFAHLWAGDFDAAEADFSQTALLPVIYYAYGKQAAEQGDWERAVEQYTQAVDHDPTFIDSYFDRAYAYFALAAYSGDLQYLDLSIKDYNKVVELNPRFIDAYFNRGLTYSGLAQINGDSADLAAALADFGKVIELDSNISGAYLNRGQLYIYRAQNGGDTSDYHLAIQDFTSLIELEPDMLDAYLNRGWIYSILGENGGDATYLELALDDFRQCVAMDPDNATTHNNVAYTLYLLGDYEQALIDVNHALTLDTTQGFIYDTRGYVYLGLGQYENAVADFTSALTLDPGIGYSSLKGRGDAYYALEQYSAALADYLAYRDTVREVEPRILERISELEALLAQTPTP